MRKIFFRIISTLLLIASLPSCTIVKRHYTPGFYVGSKNESSATSRKTEPSPKKHSRLETFSRGLSDPQLSDQATAGNNAVFSNEQATSAPSIQTQINIGARRLADCDTIYLKDGGTISARVIEIGPRGVKYHYCTESNQELRFFQKGAIARIKFANGLVEKFDTEEKQSASAPPKPSMEMLKVNLFALAGCILAILFYPTLLFGFIFLISSIGMASPAIATGVAIMTLAGVMCVLGFIFSLIGLIQINKDSTRYKGKVLAILGLILTAIPIAAFIRSKLRI